MIQKFHRGDIVRLDQEFPDYMSHFPGAGEEALVWDSKKDKYGGNDTKNYTLILKDKAPHSWYREEVMTLIKPGPGRISWTIDK